MATRQLSVALFASQLLGVNAAPSSCATEEPRSVQNKALLQTRREDQAHLVHPTGPRIALVSATKGTDYGDPKCPCIGIDNITGSTVVNLGKGVSADYPADVGAHCTAWDKGQHPACKSGSGPSWCSQRYCFVDPCNCDIPVMPKLSLYLEDSRYQGKPIYFSYATCGGVDQWTSENKEDACVNLDTEDDCKALSEKCAWNAEINKCGGKEAMGDCKAVDADPLVVGSDGCQCIGFSNQSGSTDYELDGEKVAYPADVGATCKAWDQDSLPACQVGENETMPEYCAQKWCYVDPCKCDLVKSTPPKVSLALKYASSQGKPVYYSYATCGGADVWTETSHPTACVNQKTQFMCEAQSKCAWSKDNVCLGKELAEACTAPLDEASIDRKPDSAEDESDDEKNEQISSDTNDSTVDVQGGPGGAWKGNSAAPSLIVAHATAAAFFIRVIN